jgi:RepB DNA-primase from phage plasmid
MPRVYTHHSSVNTTNLSRRLARHIYGETSGYIAIFSGVRGSDKEGLQHRRQRFFEYPRELSAAVAHAHDSAQERNREVYFSAHVLTDERRKKEYAAPVSCLYAEVDGGELNDTARRYATAIVESSPGHYHVYVKLTRAIDPLDAELLNKRLAASIGADPSGADLSQVLRVPATTNHKYPDKPTVTLKRLLGSESHDPDELHRVLQSAETWKQTRTTRKPIEPLVEVEDEELLERARNARNGQGESFKKLYDEGDASDYDGDRSAAVYALCKHLAFWTGWDAQRMERLLENSAWRNYHKLRRSDWVTITIDKAIAATPRAYRQPAGADDPLAEEVEALQALAAALPWTGRGGPTDSHVYAALLRLCLTYGTLKKKHVVVAADERTLALDAGVSRMTVSRSLLRLEKEHKLLRRTCEGRGKKSAVYALKLPAQGYATKPCVLYGLPLRRLRNPAPMPQKDYDKNGRKIHAPAYLLQRLGKLAALVLERVVAAGSEGATLEELAASLGRKPSDLRRDALSAGKRKPPRVVDRLLEANLLVEEEGRLVVPENFEDLLALELRESGCDEVEEKQRKRYQRDREERFKERPVDAAPSHEDIEAEKLARHEHKVEKALQAFGAWRSGPQHNLRLFADGELHSKETLVKSVLAFRNVPFEKWWDWEAAVMEAAAGLMSEWAEEAL